MTDDERRERTARWALPWRAGDSARDGLSAQLGYIFNANDEAVGKLKSVELAKAIAKAVNDVFYLTPGEGRRPAKCAACEGLGCDRCA